MCRTCEAFGIPPDLDETALYLHPIAALRSDVQPATRGTRVAGEAGGLGALEWDGVLPVNLGPKLCSFCGHVRTAAHVCHAPH